MNLSMIIEKMIRYCKCLLLTTMGTLYILETLTLGASTSNCPMSHLRPCLKITRAMRVFRENVLCLEG